MLEYLDYIERIVLKHHRPQTCILQTLAPKYLLKHDIQLLIGFAPCSWDIKLYDNKINNCHAKKDPTQFATKVRLVLVEQIR